MANNAGRRWKQGFKIAPRMKIKSSILSPCRELKSKLLQVGSIVDGFQEKKHDTINRWLAWLRDTEEILKKHNYTEAAELAGLRAEILAFSNGSGPLKISRKEKFQKTLETINTGQKIVCQRQKILEEKIDDVRILIRQVVAFVKQSGAIKFESKENFSIFLERLLMSMQQHEQLGPSIQAATAKIGRYDMLRLLAEEIEFD